MTQDLPDYPLFSRVENSARLFTMIGTDFAVAVRKGDGGQQSKLHVLVVALEETRDSPLEFGLRERT